MCIKASNSNEQNLQELNKRQQRQENPETPTIGISARPKSTEIRNPGTPETAFLPYPNTGTAYQARSMNPV